MHAVTIRDGFVQAPSSTFTALLDPLAATLPSYGSVPFVLDEDFNIAQGLIRMVGVGKILHRHKMRAYRRVSSRRRMMRVRRITEWLWSGDNLWSPVELSRGPGIGGSSELSP